MTGILLIQFSINCPCLGQISAPCVCAENSIATCGLLQIVNSAMPQMPMPTDSKALPALRLAHGMTVALSLRQRRAPKQQHASVSSSTMLHETCSPPRCHQCLLLEEVGIRWPTTKSTYPSFTAGWGHGLKPTQPHERATPEHVSLVMQRCICWTNGR